MDLATIIIVAATSLGGILFLLDKYTHHRTFATRGYLLSKFREVKVKNLKLQQELEDLMTVYNVGNKTAFTDMDLVEYLEVLKEKLEIEFSDAEYNNLKRIRLSKETISDYMEKLRYHQDVLIALKQEINFQTNKLETLSQHTLKLGV